MSDNKGFDLWADGYDKETLPESHMDAERTRKYYDQLTKEDICSCAYCKNYIKEVKTAYPEIAGYLNQLGVDIEKPFEAMPADLVNGMMLYSGAQYVVFGAVDNFKETVIGSVHVFVTDSHPVTNIEEKHFVIEVAPIYLTMQP